MVVFAFSTLVIAAEFKPYPGSKIDNKATKDATELLKQSGMAGKATIYTLMTLSRRFMPSIRELPRNIRCLVRRTGRRSFLPVRNFKKPISSLTGRPT